MPQELTLRDATNKTETSLAWYQDAFLELVPLKNPAYLPPVLELVVDEDPIPFPPPPPVLKVLADDEGYDAYPKNIWAVDDGYDVWGADE